MATVIYNEFLHKKCRRKGLFNPLKLIYANYTTNYTLTYINSCIYYLVLFIENPKIKTDPTSLHIEPILAYFHA